MPPQRLIEPGWSRWGSGPATRVHQPRQAADPSPTADGLRTGWRTVAASRSATATLCLLLELAITAATREPENIPFGTEYTVRNWQTEDGLPQSSILSIAQTPDGYLWLATFGGLARFDGVRFTTFDTENLPGLPANRIVRVGVDQAGALWVITEYQDVVRVEGRTARVFGAEEGVPAGGFRWVGEDGQGKLWCAGTRGGLWQWLEGQFEAVPLPAGFAATPLRDMVSDHAGRPWFGHPDGVLGFENGRLCAIPGSAGPPDSPGNQLCPASDGSLWVVTAEGLRPWSNGGWRREAWACPVAGVVFVALCEDRAGNLWLASYKNGLFRFHPDRGWRHFTVEAGLTTLALRSLCCDREGNVWVGTDGGGLLQVKPRPWRMISRREGLGVDAVHSVSQDPAGGIWLVGGTRQPYRLDRGAVAPALPPHQSNVMDGVWAVLTARDGAIWIGTYAGTLYCCRDGALTAYGKGNGMLAGSARALFEDRQGAVWLGGFNGLSRVQDNEVTHYSPRDGLSSERVWALAGDAAGRLYVGTPGSGLNVFEGGRFRVYTRQHGLPDDYVRALHVDDEGVLWIGTRRGGLSRFSEGRFFNFAVKGGLPMRSIGPLLEDDAGWLWAASDVGILRVSRAELNAFAAGARSEIGFVTYDRSDGLATIEVGGIQPACLKARDGTLWFGTAKGAAYVDPRQLRVNPIPPPVRIEQVCIDDEQAAEVRAAGPEPDAEGGPSAVAGTGPRTENRGGSAGPAATPPRRRDHGPPTADRGSPRTLPASTAGGGASSVTLHPHQRRVEFRYTALSLTAPAKVRFRYRMEGFDPGWVDGDTARSVSYTRLPPGHYRFHVTACNDSGIWNDTGASLGVEVEPAFHQTWWFRLLVVAAVAGLVASAYHLRMSRLHQLARLRGRIAGDLHDEIGSNLGGIILLSDLTQRMMELPPDALGSLREINATAQRTATAMRDIVWFLNPDFDTFADMVTRMREFARTLLTGIACEFATPPLPSSQRLPLEFRRNVFFAFKEILHNIARHSRATRVHIRIETSGNQFTLRVEDDGCGFDVAAPGGGHGLRSLRQRATDVRGDLTYSSEPGRGTSVRFTAPLP